MPSWPRPNGTGSACGGQPETRETASLHRDVPGDWRAIHWHILYAVGYPVLEAAAEMSTAHAAKSHPITVAAAA